MYLMTVLLALLPVMFITEMVALDIFSPIFSPMGTLTSSTLDSLVLVFLYAMPLWFFLVRPLANGGWSLRGGSSLPILLKALSLTFLTEFLVMICLSRLLPGPHDRAFRMIDAGLTLLLCTPLLWMLFQLQFRNRGVAAERPLVASIKLYLLLLTSLFLIDLADDALITFFPPGGPFLSTNRIINALFFATISTPFFWLLVLRPFERLVQLEKTRYDAVQAQVIDAIMTMDDQGVIESFNPAAETIFGYSAAEMVGKSAAPLLCGGRQSLDEVVREPLPHGSDAPTRISSEFLGRRRDGSIVVMDVSVSVVNLDGRRKFLVIMRDVSERKRAVLQMRRSLSLLAATLESTADGILVTDEEGNFKTFNRKFLAMWQIPRLTAEQADIGRFLSLAGEMLWDPVPLAVAFTGSSPEGERVIVESVKLKNGRVYELYSQPCTLEGTVSGRVWSFRDITKLREEEAATHESMVRFRQIFEQTEDAIIFFKPGTCCIIDVNRAAEVLYGYCCSELKEAGLERLCGPEELDVLSRFVRGIRSSAVSSLDTVVNTRKDGTRIHVDIRGKVMTLLGVDIIYCAFRDVTDRTRMEEETREIQAKLIQTSKMTSLGLLVSGVAHEINNPNNFILANAQLMARMWDDAMAVLREYYRENGDFLVGGLPFSDMESHSPRLFNGILDGARRINEIVHNLKGFARQEPSAAGQPVDINQTAGAAISILHHELAKHTENFHLHLEEHLPPVEGNRQQLGQVIINLLMNACQALPSRKNGIWLTTGRDAASGRVTITVRDEGTGIPRDIGDRILEPFFTTKLDSGGTGLGLSICLSIIKDHKGDLEFSSERGKGTVFIVSLPAAGPDREEHSQ